MSVEAAFLDSLLHGPLWSASRPWPLNLHARLCDLKPRFLSKGCLGRGYRAIARNGRILLASNAPLMQLAGKVAFVRLQTWKKAILPGDRPEPYGILLVVRTDRAARTPCILAAHLGSPSDEPFELALDVGGGWRLEFRRSTG